MGRSFPYLCPVSGRNVQGYADAGEGSDIDENYYVPLECLACGRIHLVNPASGRLLLDNTRADKVIE
jgi:hypothetical protein